jgi:signal transduction histidine kinase
VRSQAPLRRSAAGGPAGPDHRWPDLRALRPNAALIPGWARMSATVRELVAGSVALGVLTLGAVVVEMAAHGDVAVWAANAGWTLGSITALSGALAAGFNAVRHSAPWRFYAAAAGCWLAGAVLLDIRADGHLKGVASVFWLAFPVLGVAAMLTRLPRPAVYGIFLLDAIPVILLVIATIRSGSVIHTLGSPTSDLLTELYPALYLILAANAIQIAGLYNSLRDIRPWVRLFTVAFCLMALAALIGGHPSAGSRPGTAYWADPLWTLGLLGLGASGVLRAGHPDAATTLPLTDEQGGPHALPPAAAVLGLIILLAVVPGGQRALVQAFLLVAAVLLFLRVYLVHRHDVRLLTEVVRSHERAEQAAARARASAERLRLLASVTSRIKGQTLDELLQAISDAARQVVGARCAVFGLRTADGSGFAHLATSGMDGPTRARFGELPQGSGLLGMVADSAGPVRLDQLSNHPEATAFAPGHLPLGSFLGVPVTIGASARGALYLTDKEGGFDSEDETLARLLVANAGRTITNTELYAESQAQQEQLTAQNERLRELDRMKDEFIALVSHELRTPLTSIIGYLELLDDPDLNEEQRTFTVIMHRNATRLLRLVGDLLFLAGLQAGKLKIEPGEADLAELARHALETARPAAERKHITLAFSAEPVPEVPCDGGRIAQLLDNLLSNAVKFTAERGHVTVSLGTEGHCALLSVADDGMGITAGEQERVFERFFRTDLATSRAVQGTGLGLAICKAIVDSHSGTISIESQPSRGTTFRVRLPLRSPQDGEPNGDSIRAHSGLPR